MYPAQAAQAEYELMLFFFLAKLLPFSIFLKGVYERLKLFCVLTARPSLIPSQVPLKSMQTFELYA